MLKVTPIKQNRFFGRPVRPVGIGIIERGRGGSCGQAASGRSDGDKAADVDGGQRAKAVEERQGERRRGLERMRSERERTKGAGEKGG